MRCLSEVSGVALLAEGVDRNIASFGTVEWAKVALLAEGVDRNHTKISDKTVQIPSPSSRRAWIEIDIDDYKKSLEERRPPRGGRG